MPKFGAKTEFLLRKLTVFIILEMRIRIIISIFINVIVCNFMFAQGFNIGPCGTYKPGGSLYSFNGIIFREDLKFVDKPTTNKVYCVGYKRIFYINGFEIDEQTFLKLNLKSKHTITSNNRFHYLFDNSDKLVCIKQMIFDVSINIPIFVNGIKLDNNNQDKIYNKYKAKRLISVSRSFNGSVKYFV